MALPVVTPNSPVAGSISWTGFNISWNGVSANIGAGNTSAKFVWYKHNGGVTPTLVTGSEVPDDLLPEDLLMFINKNGVGTLAPFTQKIDGSLVVTGSILGEHIGANTITGDLIAGNTITADLIAAGAIQADKLSVGTVSDNLVVNGSFEDFRNNMAVGWEVSALSNGTIAPVTGVASSGKYSIQFAATTTAANLRLRQSAAQYIPVSSASGRRMYVSARMGSGTATTSGSYLRINWYDANKVLLSSGGTTDIRSNGAMTTTFTIYEGQATPPSTARYMGIEVLWTNINVVSTLYLDEVTVHEVTMSAQIGDGQISAVKIVGNTITGAQIAANTIYADKLGIADFSNWFANGGFNLGTTFLDSWGSGAGVAVADANYVTGRALQNSVTGSYASRYQLKQFVVKPGDQFYVSGKMKATTVAGSFLPTVRAMFRDAAGTMIAVGGNVGTSTGPVDGNYVTKEAEFIAPAGAATMQLWVEMHNPVGAVQTVGDLVCRRMNGGELIVDGAITAEKIIANAIGANHISSNVITANHIGANVITAKHIGANVIVGEMILANAIGAEEIAANAIYGEHIYANAIDGKTITGATVRTAASGARVVMDSTGLNAYDSGGTNYLKADQDGLIIQGEVMAKGITMDLPDGYPMTATLGNLDQAGPYLWNTLGLHFSLDSETIEPGVYMPPAVTSDNGRNLMVTSAAGADPTETTPGDPRSYMFLAESQLDIVTNALGGMQLRADGPDGGIQAIADGISLNGNSGLNLNAPVVGVSAPDIFDVATNTLIVNGNIAQHQAIPAIVNNGSEAAGAYTNNLMNGAKLIREDIGGATQTYRNGRWDLFQGSVAYPSFYTGYKNMGASYYTAHAYFEGERVYLGGIINVVNSTISAASGTNYGLCYFPLEYAPSADSVFKVAIGAGLDSRVHVYVRSDGVVQWYCPTTLTNAATSTMWWSLDGISYRRRP